ncbi:alpha-hydroxy acid oxidase [Saccharopolyspora sp. SCSIO 74807]|uniref:alpha-hydroxy acid oxidase n=1 Tax=Saccharopolyspora sp. SCSIO 74807 TaxID=3118084 RepID=UPI0030D4A1B5
MTVTPNRPLTPEMEEYAARAVLSSPVFAFVAGAAGSRETTKGLNRHRWDAVRLAHQLPADVARRDLRSRVFGIDSSAPMAVAPMGSLGAVYPDGDLEVARACAVAGIPMVVSTMASSPVEDIAVTGAALVFQLYALRDKHHQRDLVRRAEAAGCRALVLTIDTPVRHGSARESSADCEQRAPKGHFVEGDADIDPALTMEEITALVEQTSLPVWIKGVLRPSQAERALRAGACGVIVSNHGGRQSDAAPATADVLPAVVDAVAESPVDAGVMVDSGIVTGTDVLRALALGASGVLVGRHVAYALAAYGELGVIMTLTRLRRELDRALACSGSATPADARSLLL